MSDLLRRMDRVAEKLDAEFESAMPIHDLTDEEEEAFLNWGIARTDRLLIHLDPSERARLDAEYRRIRDPRSLTDRELWKSISPLVHEWRAFQAQFSQSGGIVVEQEEK